MQVINNVAILSIILTGAALIREREHGTIEHLLVMPVTPLEIMLAKIFANGAVIVGGVAALPLARRAAAAGRADRRLRASVHLRIDPVHVFRDRARPVAGDLRPTMPQFGLLALPVIIILYLLSGSTTPLETMPAWLQFDHAIHAEHAFRLLRPGRPLSRRRADLVWPQLLAMMAFGLVTLLLCRARISKTISAAQ